ncbi:MAG TPA: IS630 family transposase [Candidatus Methylacidiphilales bacterium]|nr:IS630 family transposase [Candidatus Methylacidiphilales bacterium]
MKKTTRAAEQDRPDVKAARIAWREKQPQWDPRRLVFIDETGLNTKMARLYGRAPVGQRCLATVPHGHWQSSTFLAALRLDAITAPFLIEGALDGEVFTAYLQEALGPELRQGDLVILDNLSTHKMARVGELIAGWGAQVHYLPAYSPDLNPIEEAFAKLKAHLRQAAARTLEELQSAVAQALQSFRPEHCRGFFRHAQYASI